MDKNIKLSEINENISCPLCRGYLIDATTIDECLHTFCRSCIVKHIKNDNNECPKCQTIIHERRPLDCLIHDQTTQDIVYKLVPQLYISELKKRIEAHETRGIDPITRFVLEKNYLHVALVPKGQSTIEEAKELIGLSPIYLKCPLTVKIRHIRKLLVMKFQLSESDQIEVLYKGDTVRDNEFISNLAQSLAFCFQYEISKMDIQEPPEEKIKDLEPKIVEIDNNNVKQLDNEIKDD